MPSALLKHPEVKRPEVSNRYQKPDPTQKLCIGRDLGTNSKALKAKALFALDKLLNIETEIVERDTFYLFLILVTRNSFLPVKGDPLLQHSVRVKPGSPPGVPVVWRRCSLL